MEMCPKHSGLINLVAIAKASLAGVVVSAVNCITLNFSISSTSRCYYVEMRFAIFFIEKFLPYTK